MNCLYYFELRGRAELIRSICHYSKIPYTEKRIALGDQTHLSKFPVGQVPVWEELDEAGNQVFLINQSQTIARYIARQAGLLPSPTATGNDDDDDVRRGAMIESIQDTWSELRDICVEYVFVPAEKKFEVKCKMHDKLGKHRSFHAQLIGRKDRYFEEQLTLADFALFDAFDQVYRIDKPAAYKIAGEEIVRVYENVGRLLAKYRSSPAYHGKALI